MCNPIKRIKFDQNIFVFDWKKWLYLHPQLREGCGLVMLTRYLYGEGER